jgi:non-ribosomal peptide synthetase component E (peptide arylation enzyme)
MDSKTKQMLGLLNKLVKIKLLTPKGLWYLGAGLAKGGVNLMALLEFSARMHPNKIAIVDEDTRLTYQELKISIDNLVQQLHQENKIKKGQKIAVFCQNHEALVQAIFAI